MLTLWKFQLDIENYDSPKFILTMPLGARILTLQVQSGTPCLWAEVDPDRASELRRFVIVGTGQEVPPGGKWIGTWQDRGYVWHLYEGPCGTLMTRWESE